MQAGFTVHSLLKTCALTGPMEYGDGPIGLRRSKWATFSQGLRPRARRLLCNRTAIDPAPLRRRNSSAAKEINRTTYDREQRKAETQSRRAGPKIWPKSPPFPYCKTGKDGPPKSVNLQKSLRHPPNSPDTGSAARKGSGARPQFRWASLDMESGAALRASRISAFLLIKYWSTSAIFEYLSDCAAFGTRKPMLIPAPGRDADHPFRRAFPRGRAHREVCFRRRRSLSLIISLISAAGRISIVPHCNFTPGD